MTVSYSCILFILLDYGVNLVCLTHNQYANQFMNETYECRKTIQFSNYNKLLKVRTLLLPIS